MARRKIRQEAVPVHAATDVDEGREMSALAVKPLPRTEICSPHGFEQQVRFELESAHQFSSLVVRRIPGGICLQGVLDVDDSLPDVDSLARRIAGVERVLNQLVMVRRHDEVNRLT